MTVVETSCQHGTIYFEITWDKTWKESAGYPATEQNLERAKRFAGKVHEDIAGGRFNAARYLMRFPERNRVGEFRCPPPAKTRKSKRTIRLHPGTINVLRSVWPIHTTKSEDYVFATPAGRRSTSRISFSAFGRRPCGTSEFAIVASTPAAPRTAAP